MTEKAEGNPLFAEEIVSFLTERGMLRATAGKLDFDASAVAAALARERTEPADRARGPPCAKRPRAAASGLGDRTAFDPELLAVAVGETDIIRGSPRCRRSIWFFAMSKSMTMRSNMRWCATRSIKACSPNRENALHLKIAEEIERRSGNRLTEVAEVLAHHYSQTDRADKAFAYLSMAGSKSLSVYSLDEATTHFTAALALLDKNPDCASDDQVAEFLVLLCASIEHERPS